MFGDGTTLTTAELLARGFDIDGTAGVDILVGTNTADRIHGLSGDDALYGSSGNDTLDGGTGNDHLEGGAGTVSVPLAEQSNDLLDGGGMRWCARAENISKRIAVNDDAANARRMAA